MHTYLTNTQGYGAPRIVNDASGTLFSSDYPQDIREWLARRGERVVLLDCDGQGSMRPIPVGWIGDGEPLEGSQRCLELI